QASKPGSPTTMRITCTPPWATSCLSRCTGLLHPPQHSVRGRLRKGSIRELRAFVKGLLKNAPAVRAGLSFIWSNGPTEGFVHCLKLLKRQAYGRARVDFLRHRVLATSSGGVAKSLARRAVAVCEELSARALRKTLGEGKGQAKALWRGNAG